MGTSEPFDPNKRGKYRRADPRDWYEFRLYLLCFGIVDIPFALCLWLLMEWL